MPLTIPLTGVGAQSHLQITPGSLDFGSITLGASANRTLTLTNTGTAPLNSLTLAVTGDYAITIPCPATVLAPGATCTATVIFTPTALGNRPGTLTAASAGNNPILVPLTGTANATGSSSSFTLTVNGGATASATVRIGDPASYNLLLTPQANFNGAVVLNCTPVVAGQDTTCSLSPSSIALYGSPQTATVTLNTITSADPHPITSSNIRTPDEILLCLLPSALLFFRKTKPRLPRTSPIHGILWATLLIAATTLLLNGCGSGGDPNLRLTPPGTYQYQVTASSTNGNAVPQTVTLNLTVTAQ